MKILLWGWYGHKNAGDEAMLTSILTALRKVPHVDITVASGNPDHTSKQFGVKSFRRELITSLDTFFHRPELCLRHL